MSDSADLVTIGELADELDLKVRHVRDLIREAGITAAMEDTSGSGKALKYYSKSKCASQIAHLRASQAMSKLPETYQQDYMVGHTLRKVIDGSANIKEHHAVESLINKLGYSKPEQLLNAPPEMVQLLIETSQELDNAKEEAAFAVREKNRIINKHGGDRKVYRREYELADALTRAMGGYR